MVRFLGELMCCCSIPTILRYQRWRFIVSTSSSTFGDLIFFFQAIFLFLWSMERQEAKLKLISIGYHHDCKLKIIWIMKIGKKITTGCISKLAHFYAICILVNFIDSPPQFSHRFYNFQIYLPSPPQKKKNNDG